ncbi:hypothetical protein I3W98_36295, partial [Streptomyces cavourensis]|nr:hypothetical protein [Streptomyces cavourensis]
HGAFLRSERLGSDHALRTAPARPKRPLPPLRVQEPLYVYGRNRRPCLRCGTPIRKVDEADRPTYWCPSCQSGPTP